MSKSQPTAVKIEQWPELDQQLWRDAINKGDFLEPDGAGAHWADATKTQVQKGYGKWIFHLKCEHILEGTIARKPSERLDEDTLRSFIRRLEDQGLASQTIASRITDLAEAIRVMEPKSNLNMLKKLAAHMQLRATPSRKKHGRIKPPGEIWQACLSFMQQLAAENSSPNILQASRYRDALALGLLALRPMRRRNISGLILSQHLTTKNNIWLCSIPGQDTKDGSPIDITFPVDDDFTEIFHRYLQIERQVLLKRPPLKIKETLHLSGPLWISTRGKMLTGHAFYSSITRVSEELLGAPINPHLLRDCAASAISMDAPGNILSASRILGHTNLNTTISHYEQSSMIAASSNLVSAIEQLRKRALQ